MDSRCLFLGVHVPSHIESRWNLRPFVPLVHPPIEVGLTSKEGWRISIAFLFSIMVGVLWSDIGDPNFGTMIWSQDFYHVALYRLEMIPLHVANFFFFFCELDGNILVALNYPMKSQWRDKLTIWKMDVVIRRYLLAVPHSLSKVSIWISKKMKGV